VGTWRGHGPGAPGVAALLSLLVPGLGQAWLGAVRRGLLVAAPIVGGLLLFGLVALLAPSGVLDALVRPGVLVGLLVLILGLGMVEDGVGSKLGAGMIKPVSGLTKIADAAS
jgi:hypothetical protein